MNRRSLVLFIGLLLLSGLAFGDDKAQDRAEIRKAGIPVVAPKPIPASFAKQAYFAVTAFTFTNAEGKNRFGRFRISPQARTEFLTAEQAKKKGEECEGENHHRQQAAEERDGGHRVQPSLFQVEEPGDCGNGGRQAQHQDD